VLAVPSAEMEPAPRTQHPERARAGIVRGKQPGMATDSVKASAQPRGSASPGMWPSAIAAVRALHAIGLAGEGGQRWARLWQDAACLMRLGCTGGHYGATVHWDRGLAGSRARPRACLPRDCRDCVRITRYRCVFRI
jgi:hypothetical protein